MDWIFEAMSWTMTQKKPVVKAVPIFGDARFIACNDVYGDDADEIGQIPEMERMLRNFNAYPTSFTSGDANRVVRNSGDSQGLGPGFTMNTIRLRACMRRLTAFG